jgi:signal transduction histidine kinase/ligand-binding sensor domain-containing protein
MLSKAVNSRKAIRKQLSCLLSACVYGVLFCASVCGLDRDRTIAQFHHTSWTAKDGAPSQISALAQTADGYLWIGSARGLFRFDGVEFEPYAPPAGVTLPAHNIYALMATPDGGLWISFRPSGLGFLKNGQLRVFTAPEELPESQVYCFARDPDGRIWAGTQTGLAVFDGSRWSDVGSDWNFTKQRTWSLFVDREGTLWVGSADTILFLPRGSKSFQQTGIRTNGVPQIAQGRDGRLWMAEWSKPARPIPLAGREPAANDPEIRVEADKLLFEREGGLWMTVNSGGVRRVRFPERLGNRKLTADDPELESFKSNDGLSDDTTDNMLEDREGNIWISSSKGLDRFRRSHLVPVKLPPNYRGLTLLAGDHGDIWAASASRNPLLHLNSEKIDTERAFMEIASVYQDPQGIVWWGGQGGVWRQRKERFDFFPQPIGTDDWFWEIFPAADRGGLWARLGDRDLVHFNDGVWANPEKPEGLPELLPSSSFEDPSGRIWLGYKDGQVRLMKNNEVQSFASAGPDIGRIKVIRGRGPHFWFGGELGLAIFNDGRFRTVLPPGGQPFGSVSGIVETPDGGLWLNEINGIVCISPEEIRQLINNPDHRITYRLFDFLDGMPGGPQMNFTVSTAVDATDGRLWFATDNGLAWIDPANIAENPIPPPVSIRALRTGERTFDPSLPLKLPQGTTDLRIDYTALSYSIPEKVRFRYKLEGIDGDWQDANTRRQAFYNNLGPGRYLFRVIACNNDGVWNETGAALDFSIEPMFYQTVWFRFLLILLALFLTASLLLLLYRWRLARTTERLSIGFEERLAERTRIAHELHDTMLQGFLGATMRLQAVSNLLPAKSEKAKENLDKVLDQIDLVLEEGRRAIWGIQSSSVGENDLIQAFTLAGEDLTKTYRTNFSLTIEGESRPLQPPVRDQIYRIGREALTNAFRHSQATEIELELEYSAKHLRLVIRDNGCGISPDYLSAAGRFGHLGLSGMREYAEQIGAELKIWSRIESGTEVELVVPHQIAFVKKSSDGVLKRLGHLYKRKTSPPIRDKD